ncbi:unnamed protein product [Trifolium pratense]|uniref:Uncharacterized protein n=1 Tax=Trifolium pratense TaxID=57577 RepID=A0ACB0JJX6_TRIPR|nr:unnamed protein product [Trifolium pratense]
MHVLSLCAVEVTNTDRATDFLLISTNAETIVAIMKYDCGYVKRKKKIRLEKLTQSQSGAIEKFIIKEPQNVENIDADIVDVQTVDIENAENVNNNIDVENVVDDNESVDVENENVDDDNEIVRAENVDVNEIGHDIFDPTIWDSLDSRMRDLLVTKGPKRDCSIVKGPKDKFSRRFLANWYTRVLPNGETCDSFAFVVKFLKEGLLLVN